uniref:Uncharacterized protein n=1 Tax=Knipowitschia caucasica TaxID=637954 RepID=A0AAV2L642_KNICA
MSGSGSGPGSDYDEGELVEPSPPTPRRMRMAMPVQPASPPVDCLQSLAPSPGDADVSWHSISVLRGLLVPRHGVRVMRSEEPVTARPPSIVQSLEALWVLCAGDRAPHYPMPPQEGRLWAGRALLPPPIPPCFP